MAINDETREIDMTEKLDLAKPARGNSSINALALSEEELIKVLQSSIYPGAAIESIKLVLGYCKAAGLDPIQKPVHIVPMWDSKSKAMRDVIMPGINLYRTQAARSGECAGVSEPEFGEDVQETLGGAQITYPKWCQITVKRRLATGEIANFTAKEYWKENYAVKGGAEKSIAPNSMWMKRPIGQISKCAQAQAFRMAFPEMASAYTAEEMEGKALNDEIEITQRPAARPERALCDDAVFLKNFPKWESLVQAGKKSADDIIASIESKAILSEDQIATIKSIVVQEQDIEQ